MRGTFRHSRGLLLALVALAVSASIALAKPPEGNPNAGPDGPGQGAEHSGKTVGGGSGAATNETEPTELDETVETLDGDGGENCATDPSGLSQAQLEAMTHGSIVCWAAHQETPGGYGNHGAFVSEWAHWGKTNASPGKSAWGHSQKALKAQRGTTEP